MTIHQPPGQPLKTVDALVERGLVAPERRQELAEVAKRYAVSVTPAIAALIDPSDEADPIARQFIPAAAELTTLPEELADPIGDAAHSPVEGVVHRYPDRALLKLVHACPVYCRFCFRREMVGPGGDALTGDKLDVSFTPDAAVTVVLAADGYPASPRTGDPITGLEVASAVNTVTLFHAGTTRDERGVLHTAGGRVLNVTATGVDLEVARVRAYEAAGIVDFKGMTYRRDIAAQAAAAQRRSRD